MIRFNSHRDLVVWQESINLAATIFKLADQLSFEDKEKLGIPMQKSAIAVSTFIAEGPTYENQKDFISVLRKAIQKLVELDSLLALSRKLNFLEDDPELDEQINKVERMIIGLIRSLINPPRRDKTPAPRAQADE